MKKLLTLLLVFSFCFVFAGDSPPNETKKDRVEKSFNLESQTDLVSVIEIEFKALDLNCISFKSMYINTRGEKLNLLKNQTYAKYAYRNLSNFYNYKVTNKVKLHKYTFTSGGLSRI
jgi:hypothetical protein